MVSRRTLPVKASSDSLAPVDGMFPARRVAALDRFDAGSSVTPESVREAGILKHLREPVKVLGNGDLATKLTVSAHRFSETAKAKIEAAGGTCIVLAGEDAEVKDS